MTTITKTSYEVQIGGNPFVGQEDRWITVDYVEPEQAVNVEERRRILAKAAYDYVRDARLVKIETHEDVLDTAAFKKETS
jgi:hypothetical protein